MRNNNPMQWRWGKGDGFLFIAFVVYALIVAWALVNSHPITSADFDHALHILGH